MEKNVKLSLVDKISEYTGDKYEVYMGENLEICPTISRLFKLNKARDIIVNVSDVPINSYKKIRFKFIKRRYAYKSSLAFSTSMKEHPKWNNLSDEVISWLHKNKLMNWHGEFSLWIHADRA